MYVGTFPWLHVVGDAVIFASKAPSAARAAQARGSQPLFTHSTLRDFIRMDSQSTTYHHHALHPVFRKNYLTRVGGARYDKKISQIKLGSVE